MTAKRALRVGCALGQRATWCPMGCAVFVKQLSGGVHAVKDPALFPLTNLRRREYPSAALDLRGNHG